MKKIYFTLPLIILLTTSFNIHSEEKNQDQIQWSEVGQSGKEALKGTGQFFKNLGTKIGSEVKEVVDEANEIKCTGSWTFNKGSTVITINENGTMEIVQKEKNDTHYWRGTYTTTLKMIKFTIDEEGTKGWKLVKEKDTTQNPKKWTITYSVQKESNSVKFTSSDIPSDIDGNSFSGGQIFTSK